MQVKVTKQPKSTLKIDITVPTEKVKEMHSEVLSELVKKVEIPGFRKGQAPKNIVEEKTDMSELHGEIVNKLLQKYYSQALKEHKISPISNPKVEIKEFDLEKAFVFTATVATKPEISIKGYETKLKKLQSSKKEGDITPSEVIKTLVESAKVEVADILIDDEANRMLSRLIQQIQAIGMSMEDYLKAQNKTADDLRKEYAKSANDSIRSEFILQHLVDVKKISVEEKEIENTINASGDEKTKEQMQSPTQKWYIRSVLTKNKLISKLIEEAKNE